MLKVEKRIALYVLLSMNFEQYILVFLKLLIQMYISMNVSKLYETYIDWLTVFIWQQYRSTTVMPAKSDSDVMFCLQSYQGLKIDRSRVY